MSQPSRRFAREFYCELGTARLFARDGAIRTSSEISVRGEYRNLVFEEPLILSLIGKKS